MFKVPSLEELTGERCHYSGLRVNWLKLLVFWLLRQWDQTPALQISNYGVKP